MNIELKVLDYAKDFYLKGRFVEDSRLPKYAKEGDAGLDLRVTEDVTICPNETRLLPTGLAIWIGSDSNYSLAYNNSGERIGVMGVIVPRSSVGLKGLILANIIGVLDENFQGEIKIAAWNRLPDIRNCEQKLKNMINLQAGDRIAQLIFQPFIKCQWNIVKEFSQTTDRGEGGLGSSGIN